MKRKPDYCRGSVDVYRRGGAMACENCTDQVESEHMLWCNRYGNEPVDPSRKTPYHKGKGSR